MLSRCLQTSFIPEDHTGENLAEAMKSSLEAWELDESKQVCLTTDSGAWKIIICLSFSKVLSFSQDIKKVLTHYLPG